MRTAFVVSALAFILPALGAPTVIPITKRAGPVKPNSYIVTFKDAPSKDNALSKLADKLNSPDCSLTYDYGPLYPGVAAMFSPNVLNLVRGLSGVESIEQDSILSLVGHVPGDGSIDHAPHVAEPHGSLVGRTDAATYGEGVTVYGIDTGIYIEHECFGGRATWGATFGGYADKDGNGHGTHTAATAVCKNYGIATGAKVIAVKVMSDQGAGSTSDIIAGIQYAFNGFKASGGPAVATMSLGGSGSSDDPMNKAVQAAIAGGLHFTIAAGNSYMPADGTSPANTIEANTIGAVDASKNNQKADFSNYGKFIDVWAPGVNIKSAWIGNPQAENTISGTSMATPYVAGILAVALSKNPGMSPSALSEKLKDKAEDAVTFALTDIVAEKTSNHLLAQPW